MSAKIIALHGFLGRPNDFKGLNISGIIAPNLFLLPICPLKTWAQRFIQMHPPQSIIIGYSLGGRLALHCLVNHESHYRAAIIIAAHPGLKSSRERIERVKNDDVWAKKFLSDPWTDLMNDWNTQSTLKSSAIISRNERDFCRVALAKSLSHFSLGKQDNLAPFINQLTLPILWLYASDEEERHQSISLRHPLSRKLCISGGHRFMFDHQHVVSKAIHMFNNSVS